MPSDEAQDRLMSAWAHDRAGHPSKVLSVSRVPIPTISPNSSRVLVRVSHCALNVGASILMQLVPSIFRSKCSIPEMDFAGEVIKCGDLVPVERGFAIGSKVFGSVPVSEHVSTTSGALGQFVVVDHLALMKTPSGVESSEVAGLGIAGATALELMARAELKKGDSVLVNGASGGIGHLIVQICRQEVGKDGKVVAVCSTENVGWLKELGCTEVIDYKMNSLVQDYLARIYGASSFDAVIDAVGIQDIFNSSPKFLGEGKPYVTVGPRAHSLTYMEMLATINAMVQNLLWPKVLGGTPRRYIQVTGVANPGALEQLARMVAAKTLKVHIGAILPMNDVLQAYELVLSGHTQGKVLVALDNNVQY